MAALENSAIDLNALSSFNRCNMNGNNGEAGGTRRAKWSFTGTSFKQRRGAYYGVFIVLVVVVFVILSIHPLPQKFRGMESMVLKCMPQSQSTTATAVAPVSITNVTRESRISPIDMKLICDAHHGTLPQPDEYIVHLREHSVSSGKYYDRKGVVVFVDSNAVHDFLENHASRFAHPFVLVSGDSDTAMPETIEVAMLASDLIRRGQILHWYAMNCQLSIMPNHYTCIPNGISQWNHQREAMQIVFEQGHGLVDGLRPRPRQPKKESPMAIMAFNVQTNPDERRPLWVMGCGAETNSSLTGLVECFYNGTGSLGQQVEFYKYLSTIKFVFSPHGAGLDCYRTYEALYLGSYPIVKTSSLDVLYENLPVLIVGEWSDVNEELLEATYERFQQTTFDYTSLYREWWSQRFRSHFVQQAK